MSSAALSAGVASILASCAPSVCPEFVRRHVVAVDEEGAAVDPVTREKLYDRGQCYFEDMLVAADEANDARQPLRADLQDPCPSQAEHGGRPCTKVRRILIHVHGGLNSSDGSLEASEAMATRALAETDPADWYYPIFITWPSGVSTYAERLFTLRQSEHAPRLAKATSPFYLLRDLLVGIINIPRNWSNQGMTDAQLGFKVAFGIDVSPYSRAVDQIYASFPHDEWSARGLNVTLMEGEYRRSIPVQAGRFVSYWALLPLKLVTSSLFLDGLGTGAWEVMLHRAQNLFRPAKEYERAGRSSDSAKVLRELQEGATGAFAEFLRTLRNHMNAQKGNPDSETPPAVCYQIVLVGHSMGAIVLNEALTHFQNLPVTRIVYMAPACSIHDSEHCLLPFLFQNRSVRFHLLTLHPQAEADEWNVWDIVPRGSLLEWIDNFFSTPTTHEERRLGKWANVLPALRIFAREPVRGRVTIKAFGTEQDSFPQQHVHFNLCPFWKRSFWSPDGPLVYFDDGNGNMVPGEN